MKENNILFDMALVNSARVLHKESFERFTTNINICTNTFIRLSVGAPSCHTPEMELSCYRRPRGLLTSQLNVNI